MGIKIDFLYIFTISRMPTKLRSRPVSLREINNVMCVILLYLLHFPFFNIKKSVFYLRFLKYMQLLSLRKKEVTKYFCQLVCTINCSSQSFSDEGKKRKFVLCTFLCKLIHTFKKSVTFRVVLVAEPIYIDDG